MENERLIRNYRRNIFVPGVCFLATTLVGSYFLSREFPSELSPRYLEERAERKIEDETARDFGLGAIGVFLGWGIFGIRRDIGIREEMRRSESYINVN